jgi:hypothetical protein
VGWTVLGTNVPPLTTSSTGSISLQLAATVGHGAGEWVTGLVASCGGWVLQVGRGIGMRRAAQGHPSRPWRPLVALTCGWAARRSSLKLDCTLGLYATCRPLQVLNISVPSTPAPNGDLVLVANVSTLCGAAAPLCILTNVSAPAGVTQFAQLPSLGSQQLGAPVVSFNVRVGMACLCVGCVWGCMCGRWGRRG